MTKTTTLSVKIEILKDGPYIVSGNLPLNTETIVTNNAGESVRWEKGPAIECGDRYALCRCGQSASKPFCDGTHSGVDFDGTETASRIPYLSQAVTFDGPPLSLLDAEGLCAFARFCDPHGRVWNLVRRTDDPEARRNFLREVADCPAGRLVARDQGDRRADRARASPLPGPGRGSLPPMVRSDLGPGRSSGRRCERGFIRGPKPGDTVPLRGLSEQAFLRWDPR